MAFQKSYTIENGADGDHWQIDSVMYFRASASAQFSICLWKDAQHCKDNKPAIFSKSVALIGQDFMDWNASLANPITNPTGLDVFTATYTVLAAMTSEPWFGGTIVMDEFWYIPE